VILKLLDPDPESESLIRIRIQGVIYNADPDPIHWMQVYRKQPDRIVSLKLC